MIDVTAANEIADDARARSNVARLAAAQALTGANSAVIFATGSIVGATLAPDLSLATVPLSMYVVGLAAGTQLLYILPCFPPYDPGSLGWRLAGLTVAVVALPLALAFGSAPTALMNARCRTLPESRSARANASFSATSTARCSSSVSFAVPAPTPSALKPSTSPSSSLAASIVAAARGSGFMSGTSFSSSLPQATASGSDRRDSVMTTSKPSSWNNSRSNAVPTDPEPPRTIAVRLLVMTAQ